MRYGQTPVVIQSPRGTHALYRHNGEGRHIKPWGSELPADVLGGGYAIGANSCTSGGEYCFLRGSLGDLKDLRPADGLREELLRRVERQNASPSKGHNDDLFKRLLRVAKRCDDFDSLLAEAREINMTFKPQLADEEVVKTAKSAWKYEGGRPQLGRPQGEGLNRPRGASLLPPHPRRSHAAATRPRLPPHP